MDTDLYYGELSPENLLEEPLTPKDDLKSVNEFMDSASNMASCMKSEFAQRADDEPADKAEENMGEPAEEIVEVNAGEKTEETPDADAAE